MQISRSLFSVALVILGPAAAGAQHFPSDEDLMTLIQSRVDEDRAVGIVLVRREMLSACGSRAIFASLRVLLNAL